MIMRVAPFGIALLILLNSCTTSPSWIGSESNKVEVARDIDNTARTEKITGRISGAEISASVKVKPYDEVVRRDIKWLGGSRPTPAYVVDQLSVMRNGKNLAIPTSLYEDFSDFKLPSYTLHLFDRGESRFGKGEEYAVGFSGMDGENAYFGYFVFRNDVFDRLIVNKLAKDTAIVRRP